MFIPQVKSSNARFLILFFFFPLKSEYSVPESHLTQSTPSCPVMTRDWAVCPPVWPFWVRPCLPSRVKCWSLFLAPRLMLLYTQFCRMLTLDFGIAAIPPSAFYSNEHKVCDPINLLRNISPVSFSTEWPSACFHFASSMSESHVVHFSIQKQKMSSILRLSLSDLLSVKQRFVLSMILLTHQFFSFSACFTCW